MKNFIKLKRNDEQLRKNIEFFKFGIKMVKENKKFLSFKQR